MQRGGWKEGECGAANHAGRRSYHFIQRLVTWKWNCLLRTRKSDSLSQSPLGRSSWQEPGAVREQASSEVSWEERMLWTLGKSYLKGSHLVLRTKQTSIFFPTLLCLNVCCIFPMRIMRVGTDGGSLSCWRATVYGWGCLASVSAEWVSWGDLRNRQLCL